VRDTCFLCFQHLLIFWTCFERAHACGRPDPRVVYRQAGLGIDDAAVSGVAAGQAQIMDYKLDTHLGRHLFNYTLVVHVFDEGGLGTGEAEEAKFLL
jgi:hypothetical protein